MFKLLSKFDNKYNVLDYDDGIIESVYLADIIYTILKGYEIEGVSLDGSYIKIECDSTKICYNTSSKCLIVGSRRKMNCGLVATVIEDFGSLNIVVQFEDGFIRSATRQSFYNGNVANPNCNVCSYRVKKSYSIVGERRLMNCGLYCTVIGDTGFNSVTVQFDDGCILSGRRRDSFNKGTICHPSLKDRNICGLRLKMKCGLYATVIKDEGTNNITVEFENGIIIENRSRRDFKNGNISIEGYRGISNIKSCLGERAIMCNGLWAEIISYTSSRNISVRFDIDGYTVHNRYLKEFRTGYISHPNYTPYALSNILGQVKVMKCGVCAKVIKDNRVDDIDVQFADGLIVYNRHRYEFLNGNICHPDYKPKIRNSLLGVSRRMCNGLIATVIRDNGVNDIDVQFDIDNYVVYNTSRVTFNSGYIRHPSYTLNSLPELLVYRYIHTSFPDAVHNYRPDWLKNKSTGKNLELDIWIPSLNIGIEYDGFTFHNSETELSKLKFNLIVNSKYINKVYTLLEPNCIVHSSFKHENIRLSLKSGSVGYLELSFKPALQMLLESLGINRVINFNSDVEFNNIRGDS